MNSNSFQTYERVGERKREREHYKRERERENKIDEKVRRKNISLKGPPHSLLFLYLFFYLAAPCDKETRDLCLKN